LGNDKSLSLDKYEVGVGNLKHPTNYYTARDNDQTRITRKKRKRRGENQNKKKADGKYIQ
jgi:hypothetical protein